MCARLSEIAPWMKDIHAMSTVIRPLDESSDVMVGRPVRSHAEAAERSRARFSETLSPPNRTECASSAAVEAICHERCTGKQRIVEIAISAVTVNRFHERRRKDQLNLQASIGSARHPQGGINDELLNVETTKNGNTSVVEQRPDGDRYRRMRGIGRTYLHAHVDDAVRLVFVQIDQALRRHLELGLRRCHGCPRDTPRRHRRVRADRPNPPQRPRLFRQSCKPFGLRHAGIAFPGT